MVLLTLIVTSGAYLSASALRLVAWHGFPDLHIPAMLPT